MKEGVSEYAKRIRGYEKLELVEVKDEKAPESNSLSENEAVKKIEGERILKQIKEGEYVILLDLAGKESFVIIGRAANAILADHPNTLRLYVYASDSFKIPRVKEYYHLDSDTEAKKKMEQVDKIRQNYFNYYSDMAWGSSDGHDFMIDTSVFGIDGAVDIIIDLAERKFGKIA